MTILWPTLDYIAPRPLYTYSREHSICEPTRQETYQLYGKVKKIKDKKFVNLEPSFSLPLKKLAQPTQLTHTHIYT